ncbi:MAG: MinD/ParA family protein [Clostridiales bacterium]|mgnify:CR=1 FL=1|jgi:flagellar biosynthesis protein FlhG|nr:MinD/ParA family protein [Clostridiales bacterium]
MDQAERLREMVKNLSAPKSTARVITVTSGKGGVGKSSISVNLAIALSKLGKRVVILDADFGLANVEVMLGIRPQNNLADLIFRGKSLADIVTKGPENIGFISGGSGIQEMTNLQRSQIVYLIQKLVELDHQADIILIDTGAGITDSVIEFVAASSEVLLVSTPEPTSITDAYALLKTLSRKADFSAHDTIIRMISNRVMSDREGRELYDKLNTVVDRFLDIPMDYLGAVLQDSNISKAVIHQKPAILLYPNLNFSRKMNEFASNLCDKDIEQKQNKRGIAQLFSNLLLTRRKN